MKFSESLPDFVGVKALNAYTAKIGSSDLGDSTDSERSVNKANLSAFSTNVETAISAAKANQADAQKLK